MASLPEFDADKLALLYVQQYLHEAGYLGALGALEAECQLLYDDDKLPQGSQLMQLIWQHMEDATAEDVDEGDAELFAEEERLLHSGKDDYPVSLSHSIERVHTSNIISVRWSKDGEVLLTGSGDGTVRCLALDGTPLWATPGGAGAILSLEVHQELPGGAGWAACGAMDGSVSVLCMESGRALAACKPHAKYVIRVLWAGGPGQAPRIYAASHDQSVSLLELQAERGGLEVIKTVRFPTAVQDISLVPAGQQQQQQLVVGLRATNYLRLLDCTTLEERGTVNLNQRGDDHVSFFARHLAVSPDGRYLLVCTDTPRMLMLRVGSWQQARNFYGLPTQQFHQPAAAWHRDGAYIFAAADAGQVYIFHVGSAKAVAVVKPHPGSNVRDLAYHAATNRLATCSFDRTVRVHSRD